MSFPNRFLNAGCLLALLQALPFAYCFSLVNIYRIPAAIRLTNTTSLTLVRRRSHIQALTSKTKLNEALELYKNTRQAAF